MTHTSTILQVHLLGEYIPKGQSVSKVTVLADVDASSTLDALIYSKRTVGQYTLASTLRSSGQPSTGPVPHFGATRQEEQ